MSAIDDASLATVQASMAAALLARDPTGQSLPDALFAGVSPSSVGLRVHRNTVLGALSSALRVSFVAVDRLVGEDFFDRMAVDYVRARPPLQPQLSDYGRSFPDFIEDFPGTHALPYLAGLARFEWALDELGRQPSGQSKHHTRHQNKATAGKVTVLQGGVCLCFEASLRLHNSSYAIDQIRDAVMSEDTVALRALSASPKERGYALWRAGEGVKVQALHPIAIRFLAGALAGLSGPDALAAAASADDATAEVAAQILSREVLSASFVKINHQSGN